MTKKKKLNEIVLSFQKMLILKYSLHAQSWLLYSKTHLKVQKHIFFNFFTEGYKEMSHYFVIPNDFFTKHIDLE